MIRQAILAAMLGMGPASSEGPVTSPSPAISPATLAPGDHRFELSHGGMTRAYIAHVPRGGSDLAPGPVTSAGSEPRPVVLCLHGGTSNGATQQRYSGLDRVADRERFIAVYPDGTGRLSRVLTWNAGTCCGGAVVRRVDDVGFLRAVVDDLARRTPVDRKRVYATGMSNGAMMAYRLAAEAPDLVAAIAPVAGSMTVLRFHPSLPVPVMHIHSVDDPRALYAGGLGLPLPGTATRVAHPPVEEQLGKWIAHNGCPSTASTEKTLSGKAGTADAGNTATKLVYGPCRTGATVVLWKLAGSGHVWPGSDRSLERVLGRPTHVIDADEEIWAFFRSFERALR